MAELGFPARAKTKQPTDTAHNDARRPKDEGSNNDTGHKAEEINSKVNGIRAGNGWSIHDYCNLRTGSVWRKPGTALRM